MSSKVKLRRFKGEWYNLSKMDLYSVVEFKQRPKPDIGKFVCVPTSWIQTRSKTDKTVVVVLYPNLSNKVVENLVKRKTNLERFVKCNKYLCELRYTTANYERAKLFIDRISKKEFSTLHQSQGSGQGVNISSRNSTLTAKNSSQTPKEISSNKFLNRRHSVCKPEYSQNISDPVNPRNNDLFIDFLKKIRELTANYAELINKFAASLEENNASQIEEDMDDTSDEEDNPRKRRVSSIDLPPEYDDKDTRWTLKHHEFEEHLIELMPDSKVYVEENELGYCLKNAQNEKHLTLGLLSAVFSENAFKTCTLTGRKGNSYATDIIRPGLDKNAKDVMLRFVRAYGERERWEPQTERSLHRCIRNKLDKFKRKFQ